MNNKEVEKLLNIINEEEFNYENGDYDSEENWSAGEINFNRIKKAILEMEGKR